MTRNICTLITILAVMLSVSPTVGAGWEPPGVYVDCCNSDELGESYICGNTAYVPLRTTSEMLGATAVIWDPNARTAEVEADGLYITVADGAQYISANGRYLYAPGGCHVKNGCMMVPARLLAEAFGDKITWDCETRSVYFETGGNPIASGDSFYGDEDVYWLSRIIRAEAGSESMDGKIAVGNVVLNRIKSGDFPDSVKDVIFDNRYGVQFTPAYTGEIMKSPDDDCIIAAKLALDGANTAGESLYFSASYCAKYSWAAKNRQVFDTIGNQVFYL